MAQRCITHGCIPIFIKNAGLASALQAVFGAFVLRWKSLLNLVGHAVFRRSYFSAVCPVVGVLYLSGREGEGLGWVREFHFVSVRRYWGVWLRNQGFLAERAGGRLGTFPEIQPKCCTQSRPVDPTAAFDLPWFRN